MADASLGRVRIKCVSLMSHTHGHTGRHLLSTKTYDGQKSHDSRIANEGFQPRHVRRQKGDGHVKNCVAAGNNKIRAQVLFGMARESFCSSATTANRVTTEPLNPELRSGLVWSAFHSIL